MRVLFLLNHTDVPPVSLRMLFLLNHTCTAAGRARRRRQRTPPTLPCRGARPVAAPAARHEVTRLSVPVDSLRLLTYSSRTISSSDETCAPARRERFRSPRRQDGARGLVRAAMHSQVEGAEPGRTMLGGVPAGKYSPSAAPAPAAAGGALQEHSRGRVPARAAPPPRSQWLHRPRHAPTPAPRSVQCLCQGAHPR